MSVTLTDYNRREINFNQAQVETLLPEHFLEQYPQFVTFLKKYYDYLELAAGRNDLDNIFYAKDFESTDESFLPYLFAEILAGLGADLVDLPRLALKLGPQFLRVKGTEISIPAFFRYVFGVTAESFYPKTQIFTVGESEIGAESLRFIQDSFFYQILAIQIRSPLSANQWEQIYKFNNHPAGFALFAETRFETVAGNIEATAPLARLDSNADAITLQETSTLATNSLGVITGVDSDLATRFYVDRGISFYEDSMGGLTDAQKGEQLSIRDVLDANSPRFSSDDSDRLSDSSLQTFDEAIFDYINPYGPDSA